MRNLLFEARIGNQIAMVFSHKQNTVVSGKSAQIVSVTNIMQNHHPNFLIIIIELFDALLINVFSV